jgi:predicted MFS family arabinose efflux permease
MSETLWHHRDFRRLWAAQAVSAFGSRITRTALPIIAVASLGVAESQLGVLAALQYAPGVVLAVFAGGFVERSRKRPILIAADLVRAALVASIAVAWWAGGLTMGHVIAVGGAVGALSALFVITDRAYLPALIGRPQLPDGNAKLETTEAIAEIGGPALAGKLIDVIGAPLAMLLDAASYLWSAMFLGAIRTPEPAPDSTTRYDARRDLGVGLRAIFGHPLLRPLTLAYIVWAISGGFFLTLYAPYALRVLALDATTLGTLIAVGGIGGLLGARLARPMARRLGLGPAIIAASVLSLACALFIPLAGTTGAPWLENTCLVSHQLLSDGFSTVFVIHEVTLRQTVLPDDQLGRANAAFHVVTIGALSTAALGAGALADAVGTRAAVWVGVLIGLAAPIFLVPLRKLRALPTTCDDR